MPPSTIQGCGLHGRTRSTSSTHFVNSLSGEKRKRQEEEQAEKDQAQARRKEAATKRNEAADAQREAAAAFERCEQVCTCGKQPCPYAKWRRCPQCGPKPSVCKVRKCVQLRKDGADGMDADHPNEAAQGATE